MRRSREVPPLLKTIIMKHSAFIVLSMFTLSCVQWTDDVSCQSDSHGKGTEVVLRTEISGISEVTRSILDDDIETRITQVVLASYGPDGILTDVRYYESGFSAMKLLVKDEGESNIYALVNMGDIMDEVPENEEDIRNVVYRVDSYEDVAGCGIPMSGVLKHLAAGTGGGVIPVYRLFAKVCVRVLHTGLADAEENALFVNNMRNVSLFMRQANRRLMPFNPEGSRALSVSDVLSESDYNRNMNDRNAYEGSLPDSQLGPGPGYFQDSTFVFYVPENMQGRLLPANTNPFGKVYEKIRNLGGKSYSDICTFIEFNAWKEPTEGYCGSVMYRYYLGSDNTSDFSIERNKRYDVTLNFSESGFFVDSWKVTRGDDWLDTRTLRFEDEPFTVCPGGSENIMIHFHRYVSYDTSSELLPDRWEYELNASSMSKAGLSCSFDPRRLKQGENGYMDFCIEVSASADAVVGKSFPIKIMTPDGEVSDETTITIVRKTELKTQWDFVPEYVSQYGILRVEGYEESDLPLSVKVSDSSVASCSAYGTDSFRITSLKEGTVNVTVSSADGTRKSVASLTVKAPVLDLESTRAVLNPDGRAAAIGYSYLKEDGAVLDNYDIGVFNSYLMPVLSGLDYFASEVSHAEIVLYIDQLTYGSSAIRPGDSYVMMAHARNCPGVDSKGIAVMVTDPFAGITERNYGSLDDYTLFSLPGVHASLKSAFDSSIKANASMTFSGPVPDADPAYVTMSFEPRWAGFSNSNGVYAASRNPSTGSVSITQKTVTGSTKHSAGVHDLELHVKNRHSSETLSHVFGTINVYVHTAIGAEAEFGKSRCNYSNGGTTFAAVYNQLLGRTLFTPGSSNWIHYADVTMNFMTPVSGVYVLEMVQARNNAYDALNFISPGVSDCTTDANTGMLYSVCMGGDSRISVCGEEGGGRAGVGKMLYRTLYMQTFGNDLSDLVLKQYFFGYTSVSVPCKSSHAPRYRIHDMNKGTSAATNVVTSRSPYHFSPASCSSYRDASGKGYHVIHFLETIVPKTYGWINLL